MTADPFDDPVGAVLDVEIGHATNMFGHLGPNVAARLRAVLTEPTEQTWDNAYSIIINGRRLTTLWQAVLAVDPEFLRVGPRYDGDGNRVTGWQQIPDRTTLLRALQHGCA